MKKLGLLLLLGACSGAGVGCDLSRYDAFVGQDVSALPSGAGTNFVVIENGEVWTPDGSGTQTIVFLDADRNIMSFGCG